MSKAFRNLSFQIACLLLAMPWLVMAGILRGLGTAITEIGNSVVLVLSFVFGDPA